MSLPSGNIKSIQTPDSVNHEIIPERLKGGNFRYKFELNQVLTNRGVRLYVDRNYESNLSSYLAGLTYDSNNPLGVPICNLMTVNNSTWGASYYLLAVDLTSQNLGYLLATFDDYAHEHGSYGFTVRYATVGGSAYTMTWTQGYNNLDASDGWDFISEDGASCTVAYISDTTWNGYYIFSDAGVLITGSSQYLAKLPPLTQDSVLALQSDLENYVDKTTNQEIDGTKTFLDRPLSKDIYTQLAYIQSPATSASVYPYIRTGIIKGVQYTTKLTCILDGYFTESQSLGFCGYDSGGQLGQSSGKWSTEAGSSSVNCVGSSNRATIKQVIDFSNAKDTLYTVSGSTETQIAQRSVSSASSFAAAGDYPLFVAYNGAFSYKPAKLVMYSFKMYDQNDTLLRDYVPVRNSKNEVGLLDLVENKFYKNLGNEDFIAGSDVTTLAIDSQLLTSDDVAAVALSGSYLDLSNKPTIISDVKVNSTTVVSSGQANIVTNNSYNASSNRFVVESGLKKLDTTATTAQSTNASESLSTTGSETITLHKIAKTGTYSDLIGKPTIPTVSTTGVTDGTNTYNASDKLDKVTYEWNKSVAMGSSGYVKIGSFPMYDSNITIDIDATTSQTYHGTVVIATQNVSTTSMGSAHKVEVYGDPSGTIASSLRVVWTSGSRNYDVYFVPQPWSKNLIHIRAVALSSTATDVCISQTGTAPTSTSGLEAVNKLATVAGTGSYSDLSNKPTIPTVNNATLTLTQNGVTKGTFTANASSDVTIALDGSSGVSDYNDLTHKPITNIVSGTTYSEGNYYRKSVDTYLEPFMCGRTISQGDKIYFDTTKGDEVSSLLATLPYSNSGYNLLNIGNDEGIVAVSLSGYKLLAVADGSGGAGIGGTVIFSNRAGTVTSGLTVTAGWQNLANDGSYTWAKSGTSTIGSLSADDWNGVFIGTSWNESKALTKYEIGDLPVDLSTDGVYIDVSKEKELVAFLKGLPYIEGEPAGFAICQLLQIGSDSGIYAIRDATGDDTKYLACLLTEGFGVFYATGSGTVMPDTPYETIYGKGFQNLTSDNCYLYAAGESGTGTFSIRAIVNSEWNGKFFGSAISNKEGAIYRYEGGELKRVLVEGDAAASGGGSVEIPVTDVQVNGTSILDSGVANIVTETAYDATNNKIATTSDVSNKMDKVDPTGTGKFQLNGVAIGEKSIVIGNDSIAYGGYYSSAYATSISTGLTTTTIQIRADATPGVSNAYMIQTGTARPVVGSIVYYNNQYRKIIRSFEYTYSTLALSYIQLDSAFSPDISEITEVTVYNATSGNGATGLNSFAVGSSAKAFGMVSSALQYGLAAGTYSFATNNSKSFGQNSFAEGQAVAIGNNSHAEGYCQLYEIGLKGTGTSYTYEVSSTSAVPKVNDIIVSSEDYTTKAVVTSVNSTSTTGTLTVSSTLGTLSNYGGLNRNGYLIKNGAYGTASHSENAGHSYGNYSHAEGVSTSLGKYQHTFGRYNTFDVVSNPLSVESGCGYYIEMVGNGTSTSARSNARTLDWNGNEVLAGGLTIGAYSTLSDGTNSTTISNITSNLHSHSNKATLDAITTVVSSVNGSSGAITNIATRTDYFTYYGTCSTAAATKDKVATIVDATNFSLRKGVIVGIKFSNTNTFSASADAGYVTLDVNGTGAKTIWWNNTGTPTGTNTKAFGYANRTIYYMYDGTYWVFLSASTDDNSTGYLSYTCTSTTDTSKTNYLVGKQTVSSNTNNFYNSNIYFKNNALYSGTINIGPTNVTLSYNSSTKALDFTFN